MTRQQVLDDFTASLIAMDPEVRSAAAEAHSLATQEINLREAILAAAADLDKATDAGAARVRLDELCANAGRLQMQLALAEKAEQTAWNAARRRITNRRF